MCATTHGLDSFHPHLPLVRFTASVVGFCGVSVRSPVLGFSLCHHYQGRECIYTNSFYLHIYVYIYVCVLCTHVCANHSIVKLVLILLFIYMCLSCTQEGQRCVNTVPDPRGRTVRQEVKVTVEKGLGQSRAHPVS